MMTRNDFELLARSLAETQPAEPGQDGGQWYRDCNAIASLCAAQNSRFDRHRFLAACGAMGTHMANAVTRPRDQIRSEL